MDSATLPLDGASAVPTAETAARTQIRGSLLLLIGRIVSLGVNFGVQVLTVRYLTKGEFGAWAYALAVVTLGTHLVVLGLDKTLTRFVPIYQEKKDYAKMFGTIVMMVGTVIGLGLVLVALVLSLSGILGAYLAGDALARSLVLILIVLAPVQALDSLLVGMLATFAPPSAIFFRKHILAPGLRAAAVLLLIITQSSVYVLAVGYLAAAVIGVFIYSILLVRALSAQGLLSHFSVRHLEFPAVEVFSFSVPLLSSDLVFLLRGALIVLLLEHFWNSAAVADFRAVLPVARLNQIVFESCHFLFMPAAARLFARNDRLGINGLYWRTALWIAVFSFPIFAVSFSLAEPVAVLLFGTHYAESGIILAVLSLGFYFNAATGFNALTLRVFGRVRYIVGVDFVAAAISVMTSLLLVPRLGALGGAIGTCFTLILHNILNQLGLLGSGIQVFQWRYARAYLIMAVGAAGLLLVQLMFAPPYYVAFGLAATVSLVVFVINRDLLDIQSTFPELERVRWIRPLLAKLSGPNSAEPSVAPELISRLRDRVHGYSPETAGPASRIQLVSQRSRRRSTQLTYMVSGESGNLPLLVKLPRCESNSGRPENRPADHYPRLNSIPAPGERAQLEYATLARIREYFTERQDPRFGAIRVFDFLPENRALVMEHLPYPSLSQLLMKCCRPAIRTANLESAVHNAGSWLRIYHELSAFDHTRTRHETRVEFLRSLREFADYLVRAGQDAALVERVTANVAALAQSVLPEFLPLGVAHGDFAPRNILVGSHDQIIVFDTLARWRAPIYEDIAHFLIALKLARPQVYSLGLAFGKRLIARYELAFLRGYFQDDVIPFGAIRLFERLMTMDKWTAVINRYQQSRGIARLAQRGMASLWTRAIRRQLQEPVSEPAAEPIATLC